MKHGANAAKGHANPTAGPLADFGSGGEEQSFYIIPSKIGRGGLSKDAVQCLPVTLVHRS